MKHSGWGRWIDLGGWIYLVIDHNLVEQDSQNLIHTLMGNYGGGNEIMGHGSFADYPRFGQERNIFFEDNTVLNQRPAGTRFTNLFDGDTGARIVVRHNFLKDTLSVGYHGTEGQARGGRLSEVYFNTVNYKLFSGSHIWDTRWAP